MVANRKRVKILEIPSGEGQVCADDKELVRVSYSLTVQQEVLIAGQEEVEGLKSVTGRISVLGGNAGLLWGRGRLTLLLADGRRVDFFITRYRPVQGTVEIQPTGAIY